VPPNQREYQTVILAGFLHDIGKLLGRGRFKLLDKGQHPEFSATFVSAHQDFFSRFVDAELLRELVQKHHENSRTFASRFLVQSIDDAHVRALASLVSKADNLASSERGEAVEQYRDYKTTPLCSVLERLGRASAAAPRLHFRPNTLPATSADGQMEQAVFGEEFQAYDVTEMNTLIKSFGAAFSQLVKSSAGLDFDSLVTHLTNLVYVHAWCVPSNTQEEFPDVSLFDHLKVTAAIASCLYQYHAYTDGLAEKDIRGSLGERFLLVAGDISGIQQYIFGITSAGGGVARKLRARSLFVQLCTEVAAHKVLRRLGLPLWNMVMNSGGNFLLLLPNLPQVVDVLNDTQAQADHWFISNLNGELALNLAWWPLGDNGFRPSDELGSGFGTVLSKIKATLSQRKQRRFGHVIQQDGSWQTDRFVIDADFEGKGACRSCYKFPAEVEGPEGKICLDCSRQALTGARLPRTRYVCFFDKLEAGEVPLLGCSVSASERKPAKGKTPYLVLKLNDPDLSDLTDWSAASKYLAAHVPQEAGNVLTFTEIATKAKGQHLLGFLKADIDSLGELLVFGLKGPPVSFDTMSRHATLSRFLDTFFTGWVENRLSSEFKNCYTVFSGGDDLFLVGPWNEILLLAEKLNADFARFTGNPHITMSAGVAIVKPDYPVARAAQLVEDALKRSKDSQGKNSITILGTTLKWDVWPRVKREWQFLEPLVQDVPSAFLYNLLTFADMWRRYDNGRGDVLGLRYHPLLTYSVSRNLDPKKAPQLHAWTTILLKWPPGPAERTILDNLGLIATLCLYSRRGG
jgi:CRISPR-associated protein Csm1